MQGKKTFPNAEKGGDYETKGCMQWWICLRTALSAINQIALFITNKIRYFVAGEAQINPHLSSCWQL